MHGQAGHYFLEFEEPKSSFGGVCGLANGPTWREFPPFLCSLMGNNRFGSLADIGQVRAMSVIPLKADIHQRGLHVRLVPEADMVSRVATLGSVIRAQLHRRATHVAPALDGIVPPAFSVLRSIGRLWLCREGVCVMASLYETLSDAQQGEAIAGLGREFGLTPEQTQAAVESLLPAISLGLKQSTATPEGLGDLFAIMGRQTDLHGMYDDPRAAFSREGRAAGNEVLAKMFGSPDASRAIADQAQQFSGVSSAILKKLLPILAGILISGLMRSGSGQAAPSAPQTSPDQGGGLIDILRQIFGQGAAESAGPTASPAPSGAPPSSTPGGSLGDEIGPGRNYRIPTGGQPSPIPADPGGQAIPGGDVFGQILTELGKAIQDGRLKPVVIGPVEIPIPGQAGPAGGGQPQQAPGGDILGQILRDILSGAGGQVQVPRQALMNGAGAAVFGDRTRSRS